jgi:hypothetical protein
MYKTYQHITSFLVDTGALQGNYIGTAMAAKLREWGVKPVKDDTRVCGDVGDSCTVSKRDIYVVDSI